MKTLATALVLTLLVVTIFTVIVGVPIARAYGGPASSGALMMLMPSRYAPEQHDLDAGYEPTHRGHVLIGSGVYVREDEDLVLRRTPAFVLRRAYLSGYRVPKEFGIGATDSGERYLIGDPVRFQWASLILENGSRVNFTRTSIGTSYANAVFVHHETPTGWDGTRLGWVGFGWAMQTGDGGLDLFRGCGQDHLEQQCVIVKSRDWDGHWTLFNRDAHDLLRSVATPSERISLEYDARRRVTQASDSAGHRVAYTYDDGGRLIRASYGDGVVRSYQYDVRDEMTGVDEPGRSVRNTFDADGRVVKQVVFTPPDPATGDPGGLDTMKFAYTVEQGRVVATDVTEYDGSVTRHEFNTSGYDAREIFQKGSRNPIAVTFDRDATNNVVAGFTVSCTTKFGPTTHHFDFDDEQSEYSAVHRAVDRLCRVSVW